MLSLSFPYNDNNDRADKAVLLAYAPPPPPHKKYFYASQGLRQKLQLFPRQSISPLSSHHSFLSRDLASLLAATHPLVTVTLTFHGKLNLFIDFVDLVYT